MKKTITTFIFILTTSLFSSCQNSIEDKSIQIIKFFQNGDIVSLEKEFYSLEIIESISNFEDIVLNYQKEIKDLTIDDKKNFIIEQIKTKLPDNISLDSIMVYSVKVPMGIKMPSVIPKYFFILNYIKEDDRYKLISFGLAKTKQPDEKNEIEIINQINIEKDSIRTYEFMYEGGYVNPLVFKRKRDSLVNLNPYEKKIDTLLYLLNNSKIIKWQKENDTKRFNGDVEMNIISFKMNDKFNWTLFDILSEEPNKNENRYGDLELRYYKYLNTAITYWIEVEDKNQLKKIMDELCNSGLNIRIEPKKSVKLETTK